MSNRLKTLLERMPAHFAKDEDSNNYKLLKIVAENSNENRAIYDTILKFWDVDHSQGIGLDRLGKNVGITRGNWFDEEYRKMIKIQSIINLSEGDIPSMNLILDAYMGDAFNGLQDGWMDFEDATLLLNLNSKAQSVPSDLIKRIKPAGVRIYILLNELIEKLILSGDSYGWVIRGRITGRFKTASRPAVVTNERFAQKENIYAFAMHGRVTGRFRAGGAL